MKNAFACLCRWLVLHLFGYARGRRIGALEEPMVEKIVADRPRE